MLSGTQSDHVTDVFGLGAAALGLSGSADVCSLLIGDEQPVCLPFCLSVCCACLGCAGNTACESNGARAVLRPTKRAQRDGGAGRQRRRANRQRHGQCCSDEQRATINGRRLCCFSRCILPSHPGLLLHKPTDLIGGGGTQRTTRRLAYRPLYANLDKPECAKGRQHVSTGRMRRCDATQ